MSVKEEWLLEKIKYGSLFGYVQCDIEVPGKLRKTFVNFSPIFKNKNVGTDDIGPFIKKNSEKEGLLTQFKRMLKSSFLLEDGTIITPLLLIYLDLGFDLKKQLSLCAIHPNEVLQHFCSIHGES